MAKSARAQRRAEVDAGVGRINQLRKLGDLDGLVAEANVENPYVRVWAIRAIRKLGDPTAVSHLELLLRDDDMGVRSAAAQALGAMDESATPALMSALEDPDPAVKASVAASLGKLKGADAVDPLGRLLSESTSWQVKRSAALALGEIGDPSARPVLLAARSRLPALAMRRREFLSRVARKLG
jgi:HEAT repeat protein